MNNVISFSLWGTNPKYRIGAIQNCKLAPIIYPGWKVRVYIDDSIEKEFAKQLHNLGAEIFYVPETTGSHDGMYWRFFVNDDPNVHRYIIRDCDSRLNWREQAAVEEWCNSNYNFHIMRDHKNHIYPIQGAMWGGVTGKIKNIRHLIDNYNQYKIHAYDQNFLASVIYPMIKNDAIVHDEYFEKKPFPPHKPIEDGGWFVGQIYTAEGIPQKD